MVVSCLHSPDDAHSKFDPCPPAYFAVYDGHNGDLAAEIAKSKVRFSNVMYDDNILAYKGCG